MNKCSKMETKVKEIDNIKEIQTIELNILTKSVDLFNTNNISYILAGGTMLGAVRHNGFIPWDDDIDIFVPREDYDRIKDIFTEEKTANLGLSIKTPGMENHPFPFIKIYDIRTVVIDEIISEQYPLHIWIDVFPLDHFPDSDILHRLYLFTIRIFRTALKSKTARIGLSKGNPIIQTLFDAIYELLGGYRNLCSFMDSYARWVNKQNSHSNHYGNGTWPEGRQDYFKKEWIFPFINHKFENREFHIPLNYDKYLTQFYGDYLTPPPEEKRTRHSFKAYYVEDKDT